MKIFVAVVLILALIALMIGNSILIACVGCFIAGMLCWALISGLDRTDERIAAIREAKAGNLKKQFHGKIPEGAFLVLWRDMDMADVMSGKAAEGNTVIRGFRAALRTALDHFEDEVEVSILDDSAELIVDGWNSRLELRIPKSPADSGRNSGA